MPFLVKASYHSFCSKLFRQKTLNSIFIHQLYSNDSYYLHVKNCTNNYLKTPKYCWKKELWNLRMICSISAETETKDKQHTSSKILMAAEQVQSFTLIFPILKERGLGLLPATITFMTTSVQFCCWFLLMFFNFRICLMILDGNKDSSSPSPTGS